MKRDINRLSINDIELRINKVNEDCYTNSVLVGKFNFSNI